MRKRSTDDLTRKRSCDIKVAHESRDAAMITMKKMNNFDLHPYRCKFCGKWHLGHPKEDE